MIFPRKSSAPVAAKFGAWLISAGYALCGSVNTRKRMQIKYSFDERPDYLTVHFSRPITDVPFVSFSNPERDRHDENPWVGPLFGVTGVKQIWLQPYEIILVKSAAFSWEDLLTDIDIIVRSNAACTCVS